MDPTIDPSTSQEFKTPECSSEHGTQPLTKMTNGNTLSDTDNKNQVQTSHKSSSEYDNLTSNEDNDTTTSESNKEDQCMNNALQRTNSSTQRPGNLPQQFSTIKEEESWAKTPIENNNENESEKLKYIQKTKEPHGGIFRPSIGGAGKGVPHNNVTQSSRARHQSENSHLTTRDLAAKSAYLKKYVQANSKRAPSQLKPHPKSFNNIEDTANSFNSNNNDTSNNLKSSELHSLLDLDHGGKSATGNSRTSFETCPKTGYVRRASKGNNKVTLTLTSSQPQDAQESRNSSNSKMNKNFDEHKHDKQEKDNQNQPTASKTKITEDVQEKIYRFRRKSTRARKSIKGTAQKSASFVTETYNKATTHRGNFNWYNRLFHSFIIFLILTLIMIILDHNDNLQRFITEKVFLLGEGSTYFSIWKNSQQPVTMKFHIFNVTNPFEIINGQKAKLDELEPIEYELITTKTDVELNNDHYSQYPVVEYRSKLNYNIKSESTKRRLKDKIIHLNIPLLETLYTGGGSLKGSMSFINDNDIFIEHTIEELLWGYEIEFLKNINGFLGANLFPVKYKSENWGLLIDLANETIVDKNIVKQGKNLKNEVIFDNQFQIIAYAEKMNADCWSNPDINNFNNGTDGLGVPPFSLRYKDWMTVYRSEFMTTMNYVNIREESIYSNLVDLKIMAPEIRPGTTDQDMSFSSPFCEHIQYFPVPNQRLPKYCASEIYFITPCKNLHLPFAYSWPHFTRSNINKTNLALLDMNNNDLFKELDVDEKGNGPDSEEFKKYLSYNGVEPTTGVVWQYYKRFQVNIGFNNKMKNFLPKLKNLHKDFIYLPIFWIDASYELPFLMGGKPVAILVFIINKIVPKLWIITFTLAMIFFLIPSYKRMKKRREKVKQQVEEMERSKREFEEQAKFDKDLMESEKRESLQKKKNRLLKIGCFGGLAGFTFVFLK